MPWIQYSPSASPLWSSVVNFCAQAHAGLFLGLERVTCLSFFMFSVLTSPQIRSRVSLLLAGTLPKKSVLRKDKGPCKRLRIGAGSKVNPTAGSLVLDFSDP